MNLLTNSREHILFYEKDIEILIEVETLLESVSEKNVSEFKQLIDDKVLPLLYKIQHPVAAEYLFGMGVGFPNPYVRKKIINVIESWIPNFSAVNAIINLTQDPDDIVSFRALEVCAKERLEQSIPYISSIIGDITEGSYQPKKPVGLGAQKVLSTLLDIFGANSAEELALLKNHFDRSGVLLNNYQFEESIPNELIEHFQKTEEEGMVFIPGGFFQYGLNEEEVPNKTFDWKDSVPKQKVWIPPYFIDKRPVSNEEYDKFTESIEKDGHIFCHPNEPDNKQHRRNTYWDSRYGKNHTVTGIDFYDAFAYARWAGKELPTEFQWEKAARGPEGRIWPWGDNFDHSKVQYAGSLYDQHISSLKDWRKTLLKAHADDSLEYFTVKETKNVSTYGVEEMIGNTWEWTRSDFKTRRNFHPAFKDTPYKGVNNFAVLKGGSFYSHPGLMFPSFRGKDIAFCRHNEMGFRCVKNIPIHLLRQSIKKPITNKAVY